MIGNLWRPALLPGLILGSVLTAFSQVGKAGWWLSPIPALACGGWAAVRAARGSPLGKSSRVGTALLTGLLGSAIALVGGSLLTYTASVRDLGTGSNARDSVGVPFVGVLSLRLAKIAVVAAALGGYLSAVVTAKTAGARLQAAFEAGRPRQSRILLGVVLGVLLIGLSWKEGPLSEPGLWFWLSVISAFGCGVWAGVFATKPGGTRRQRVLNALAVGIIGGGFLVVGGSVVFSLLHPDEIREGFAYLIPVVFVPLSFLIPAVLMILLATLGGCVSALIAPRE